jgi:hypothetical protein
VRKVESSDNVNRVRRFQVDGDELTVWVHIESCELLDWNGHDLTELAVYHLNFG